MLDAVTDLLGCPHDGGGMTMTEARVLGCRAGHRFDLGRGGYVNLAPGRAPHSADTTAMVLAREQAQRAGIHEAMTAAVVDRARDVLARAREPVVLDAGAGTGHQLARVLDAVNAVAGRGLALDAAVPAARRAARAHPRIGAVVADIWSRLPVRDGVTDLVLNVFAPRNAAEFARVLRPTGTLLVLSPAPDHLREARELLGLLDVERDKPGRLARTLDPHFRHEHSSAVRARVVLDHEALLAVAGMGPSAAHQDAREWGARLAGAPDHISVTVAAELSEWSVRTP